MADIKSIDTNTDKDARRMRASMAIIQRHLSDFMEMQAAIAKIQRERYLRLIDEGFSEQQALEIASKASLSQI